MTLTWLVSYFSLYLLILTRICHLLILLSCYGSSCSMLPGYCSCILGLCSSFRSSSLWITVTGCLVLFVMRCCRLTRLGSFSMRSLVHFLANCFSSIGDSSRTHTLEQFCLVILRSLFSSVLVSILHPIVWNCLIFSYWEIAQLFQLAFFSQLGFSAS